MRFAVVSVVLLLAACGSGTATTPAARGDGASPMTAKLTTCAATAATLTLVEEALSTRTAITAATASNFAKPVTLAAGDPRLATLNALLAGLAVAPAKLTQFEPRTWLSLTCADGTRLGVEASATEQDGTVHLKIGDEIAATTAPLRRDLEALLAG